jgi:hypothetical protein
MNLLEATKAASTRFRRTAAVTFTLRGLTRRHLLSEAAACTLGREKGCSIQIPHADVAPLHARLERNAQGRWIVFSGSGCPKAVVNGIPVEFALLADGDELRLGPVAMRFEERLLLAPGTNEGPSKIYWDRSFGRSLLGSIKKSHWLALSLCIHLAILMVLSNVQVERGEKAPTAGIALGAFPEQTDPFELEKEIPDPEPNPEMEPPEPVLQSEAAFYPWDAEPDRLDLFGPSSDAALSPGGGSKDERRISLSTLRGDVAEPSDWQLFKRTLQRKGLDVAILFDSTGSMSDFLTEVKATIREMILVLQEIVPDCSLRLVTYKGDVRSSEYVVRATPMVSDPYELLNFMQSTVISGGSAEGYAAITEALKEAEHSLWRKHTEKVIVIIGDAPPFPWNERICLQIAQGFRGKVATIYKQSMGTTLALEPQTIGIFQKIAAAGRGPFLLYDQGEGPVVRRIVSAILGVEWQSQIEDAFTRRQSDKWRRVVARRLETGDLAWLFREFRKPETRPEVVDGLISQGGPRVALEMWRCLQGAPPPWIMHRVLYVLRAIAGVEWEYLPEQRDALTPGQMSYIAEAIKLAYGAHSEEANGR